MADFKIAQNAERISRGEKLEGINKKRDTGNKVVESVEKPVGTNVKITTTIETVELDDGSIVEIRRKNGKLTKESKEKLEKIKQAGDRIEELKEKFGGFSPLTEGDLINDAEAQKRLDIFTEIFNQNLEIEEQSLNRAIVDLNPFDDDDFEEEL